MRETKRGVIIMGLKVGDPYKKCHPSYIVDVNIHCIVRTLQEVSYFSMTFLFMKSGMYMHENENFAPGIIFSPQKHLWVIGLYTNSYMESSTTLSKLFIFMQETIIFMPGNFIFTYENQIFINKMFIQQIFHE